MPRQTTIEPLRTNGEPPTLPPCLESPRAKLIWTTIANYEPLSVTELCRAIDVPLLTLYPHLNALESQGVIECNGEAVQTAGDGATPKQ